MFVVFGEMFVGVGQDVVVVELQQIWFEDFECFDQCFMMIGWWWFEGDIEVEFDIGGWYVMNLVDYIDGNGFVGLWLVQMC